jgi:hypothetical protein
VDMPVNEQEEPRTRAEKELMDALRAQQK